MIWPSPNFTYDNQNPLGPCVLTRVRVELSYLNEYRFNHNFKNCVNPPCTCSLEIESTFYFILHCMHYNNICTTLLNELKSLDGNILKLLDTTLTNMILFGRLQLNKKQNFFILNKASTYQSQINLIVLFHSVGIKFYFPIYDCFHF